MPASGETPPAAKGGSLPALVCEARRAEDGRRRADRLTQSVECHAPCAEREV